MSRTVRCRWCTWRCALWWRTRRGENKNGFARLRQHVADEHWDQFLELEQKLGDEVFTKTRGA